MNSIYYKNGFFFLKDFDATVEEFDWVTYDYPESNPYFLLNTYTRQCFARDILPGIKDGSINCNHEAYNLIKNFKANPPNPATEEVLEPEGITLKDHQKEAVNLMLTHNRYGFFLGPGTGKTLIVISYLLSTGIKSALIVTPQKVIGQYKAELAKYIPDNNFVITNYEQLHKFTDKYFDALFLDESHKAKSYTSQININCRDIAKNCNNVYLFTGTPQDKSRHEILPQLAILDERVMPSKTRTYFRYFHEDDYYQPSREKKEHSKELTQIISEYTWGKKTEDVITLTKDNDYVIKCDYPGLPYTTLVDKRIILRSDYFACVADNKGVLKVKLREICNGHYTLENPEKTMKEVKFAKMNLPTSKLNRLIELLEKIPRGIIYYEFTNDLHFITKALESLSITYKIINGSVTAKNSGIIAKEFKDNEFNYLVMQSASGNAGLDFTNVNNLIFYSLPESYIVYKQCRCRIQRLGQKLECNYWHLICDNTIEEQVYASLKKKKSFSNSVFKIYN
jgi:SNF2 family DNA or RNA helicase